MSKYNKLINDLESIFNIKVTIDKMTPVHDEDYDPGYVLIVDGVVVGNADMGLEYNARCICKYLVDKCNNSGRVSYD